MTGTLAHFLSAVDGSDVVRTHGLVVDRGNETLAGGAIAVFSACRRYRYLLARAWQPGPTVVWLMLNPSTADAFTLDPTLTRCQRFSAAWGAGSLLVLNLFAYRATDPKKMRAAADPVGPANDPVITAVDAASGPADQWIAGWGSNGGHQQRNAAVAHLLAARPLSCLRVTRDGAPGHPLYLPAALTPQPWPGSWAVAS